MKTTIDNNSRVFQIVTSTGKQFFCNLQDIQKIIKTENLIEGYYKINHFWNNKPQRATKKLLNDMFKSANIDINNKIFTIDIQAKEWFDKVNGNSYHAGEITINFGLNDSKTITIPFQYGYGDAYKHSANEALQEKGLLPKFQNSWGLSEYIKNNGIQVTARITRNCKKAELKQF
jgi:hypothetical protein